MKNDNNIYINIKDIAEAKGLKSTRSIRLEFRRKTNHTPQNQSRLEKTHLIVRRFVGRL